MPCRSSGATGTPPASTPGTTCASSGGRPTALPTAGRSRTAAEHWMTSRAALEQALALILAAHSPQTISIALHDLQSGQRVELHARERMHAASTMKLAVLLAAFRLHAPMEKPVRVENRFRSLADGSEFAVDPKD